MMLCLFDVCLFSGLQGRFFYCSDLVTSTEEDCQ